MAEYPEWYDIDDWSQVTIEKLQLFHQEASICYEFFVESFDTIKRKSELLTTIISGFGITSGAFLLNILQSKTEINADTIAYITMFAMLIMSGLMISLNNFSHDIHVKGRMPQSMLNKEIAQTMDMQQIYQYLVINIQDKIDAAEKINKRLARNIDYALLILLATPFAGIMAYISAIFIVF